MEQRGGADTVRLALEGSAVGYVRLFEVLDAGEVRVISGVLVRVHMT
jgi:hypothetical protein